MKLISTPYGRKNLEAWTGLILLVFMVEHFLANLMLLLPDPAAYQWYTHTLGHNIFVRVLEVVLFLLFAVHIALGFYLRVHHRRVAAKVARKVKPKSLATRYVGFTGVIILVFLIVHLARFFVPNRITPSADFDLYEQAHIAFASWWYVGLYVVSMGALAAHLKHGIKSALFTVSLVAKETSANTQERVVVGGVGHVDRTRLYRRAHLRVESARSLASLARRAVSW